VTTVHGNSIYKSAKNIICRRQIRSTFEASSEIIYNSSILKSRSESYFPDVRNTNVHNGIPLDRVESTPKADLSDIFPEDRNVISSLGYLIERKNHSDVISCNHRDRTRRTSLLSYYREGPNREALEHQVKNNGLSEYVHFTGFVPEHLDVLSKLKINRHYGVAQYRRGLWNRIY